MTEDTLRLIAANLKNSRHAVDYLRKRSRRDRVGAFDLGVVCEAHKRRPQLDRLPGHDLLTGPGGGGPGRLRANLSQETGILLGRHLPQLGHGYQFLSPAAPGYAQVGHERWGHTALTRVGSTTVAVVALHPVPGRVALRGDDPDHPLVARYRAAMRWAASTVQAFDKQGHAVILAGDVQMRSHERQPWAPAHLVDAYRMRTLWHGLDLVAWTRELVAVPGSEAILPAGMVGPDHAALRVTLKAIR